MDSKRALLLSLIINLYFLGLCLVFGDLRFAAIDDWFMAGILSGIYGNGNNVHLTFVNALYGYCLLPFYHLLPKINWYYVGEMASIFISLTVIGYITIRRIGEKWGIMLSALLIALCVSDFYLALQFTQCATMLSAAGMLTFVYGLEKKNDGSTKFWVVPMLVGISLLWWGSWMRWLAFLMGMPFFATLLLLHIKKFWKIKITVVVGVIVVLVGVVGSYYFDKSLYQAPDYKKYMDFQDPRSLLGDGQNYNQQAVDQDLDEMGRSGRDYSILTNWNFYDNEVFAPESIKIITDLINKYSYKPVPQFILTNVLGALTSSARYPLFWLWAATSLLLMVSSPRKELWPWVSLFVIMSLIAYLTYLQRFVYRVETGIWLYASVLTIPFLRVRFSLPKLVSWGVVAVIVLIPLFSYTISGPTVRSPNTGDVIRVQNENADTADYMGLFAFMDSVPDSTVFIAKMNSYMRISRKKNPPYLAESQGSWEQLISFGFWTPYFPDVEKAFRKRGVTNPMKDVVRDNVFVIDEPSLRIFLEEHHYNKVKLDTIRNFNGMVVYKYSVVNESLVEAK